MTEELGPKEQPNSCAIFNYEIVFFFVWLPFPLLLLLLLHFIVIIFVALVLFFEHFAMVFARREGGTASMCVCLCDCGLYKAQ